MPGGWSGGVANQDGLGRRSTSGSGVVASSRAAAELIYEQGKVPELGRIGEDVEEGARGGVQVRA